MGSASGKCNFTFYYDTKVHHCKETRGKLEKIHYYQCGRSLVLDLDIPIDPERYKKKVCSIQPACSCSKEKVTLEIHNQIAFSKDYKPNKTYEYGAKQDVDTAYGFNYWLYEITREIWDLNPEFDLFISGLMPGKLFYDGLFIKKMAELMQRKIDFDDASVKGQPQFLAMLNNFIEYAEDLDEDSVVVNEISTRK